jgi:type IV fimbrial biogenesis protein FimT
MVSIYHLTHSSCVRRSGPRIHRQNGFTLTEMMVVSAISAVLLLVAAPAFKDMANSIQLSSASNVFVSALHLARSEAIKRNSRAVICKSADGVSCTANGGWGQGWIVFHDANNNTMRDDFEEIMLREQSLATSLRINGNLRVAQYVSFAPSGATKLPSGAFQAGTLTFCHKAFGKTSAREVVLNAVGRPRVRKTAVDNCA